VSTRVRDLEHIVEEEVAGFAGRRPSGLIRQEIGEVCGLGSRHPRQRVPVYTCAYVCECVCVCVFVCVCMCVCERVYVCVSVCVLEAEAYVA
jgi:hypothetical protein